MSGSFGLERMARAKTGRARRMAGVLGRVLVRMANKRTALGLGRRDRRAAMGR